MAVVAVGALLLGVAVVGGLVGLNGLTVLRAEAPVASSPAHDPPDAPDRLTRASLPAREVLRAWDRRRAAAWAAGDPAALARIYLPRAVAGRRDVALLRRWNARGVRVTRLVPQVLAVRVTRATDQRLVVVLTDRLGVVEARVGGEVVVLPADRATTRRVELRRGPGTGARWRVASVRQGGTAGLPAPGTLVP